MRELKIGTAWVRGVVGEAFTPELVINFAMAFGAWVEGGPVVIGRDTRRSSPMFRCGAISGLLATGCDVIDLGVCTTPLASFAVRELGASGGLMITGSHNDAEWNALKFIGPDGALLNEIKGEEMLDIYHASAFRFSPLERSVPLQTADEIEERYLEHVAASLDVEEIRRKGFKLAVDFCCGAAGGTASRFLEKLGCKVLAINSEPSGNFPHPPVPSIANMVDLIPVLSKSEMDLGAAMNVDGDRVAFVTADALPLSEEITLPLAALNRLNRRKGRIVTNLSTSRRVESIARQRGEEVLRTEVGESFVIDRGLQEGAVLAGEGSGGVAALPTSMTFDALLTLGMVLELMARSEQSLEELHSQLPKFQLRKGEVRCLPAQAYRVVESLAREHSSGKIDLTDGLRVDWEESWLHVRVSNTEPLVRIIVEANDAGEADRLFHETMQRARSVAQGAGD